MFSSCPVLPFVSSLEALDVAVGLQRGEEDVEEPQAEEQHGGQDFGSPRPAQLAANLRPPSVHQCADADEGEDSEERDGEGQCARIHAELLPVALVVDGSDGPRHLSSVVTNELR